MPFSSRTEKILWGKAGAACSFPGCGRKLIADANPSDQNVILGEVAHIVAQSKDGPRGEFNPRGGDIDGYENLILLCEEHHKLIDGQPNTYTAIKLIQMKEDHEKWVCERLSKEEKFKLAYTPKGLISEKVYSTLLPVIQMPRYVYFAPCPLSDVEVKKSIVRPDDKKIMLPFIIRGGNLIAFYDLKNLGGPFHKVIDNKTAKQILSEEYCQDPDLYRYFITLLNQALNKLTGRKKLYLDKDHSRYYFQPGSDKKPVKIRYRSLEGRRSTVQVAWRPITRVTGEYKKYWEHLAVGLRFQGVSDKEWCLSIRPERRFTSDGFISLEATNIGKRSTKRKSHMYNIDVLEEVNFWRDFLSDGSPRIILNFGSQNLIISTDIMSTEILWPGVPDDSKPFKGAHYADDLFTFAEYQEAIDGEIDYIDTESGHGD